MGNRCSVCKSEGITPCSPECERRLEKAQSAAKWFREELKTVIDELTEFEHAHFLWLHVELLRQDALLLTLQEGTRALTRSFTLISENLHLEVREFYEEANLKTRHGLQAAMWHIRQVQHRIWRLENEIKKLTPHWRTLVTRRDEAERGLLAARNLLP